MNTVAMFKLSNTDGVATMSSLEMVEYINSTREVGAAELRHDHFMVKVQKVLGFDAPKFLGTQTYGNNIKRQVFNFPKREAMLMAMSYSYELQAQIFDAWQDAEEALKKPVALIPNFDDPIAAAEAWITEKKAVLALTANLEEAQPMIAFHEAVVAGDCVYGLAEAAKILDIAPRKFNSWLRDNKFVMQNLVPYERFKVQGILASRFSGFVKPDGTTAPATTFVTSKGIAYFQKQLSK